MTTESRSELQGILDNSKLGPMQIASMIVCFVVIALDGFDTQSVSFVAPTLRETWSVAPELFGPLFGAGLLGTLVGSISLGSLADRMGRKPLVIVSTSIFGLMTLTCATATSIEQLGMYRFIAGIGLGGVIPNVLALISEYSPRRIRTTAIVVTFAGFPIGAILGGMASARIIPAFGWEAVFMLGGVLPILMIPAIAKWVPESARYIAGRQDRRVQLQRLLRRIDPGLTDDMIAKLGVPVERARPIPVKNLFSRGRYAWTILLWLLTFTTLLLAYFLVNWIPLLLSDAGLDRHDAIMGVVVLNLGGVIGSFFIGRITDRRGPFKALAVSFFIGAIGVASVGWMIDSPTSTLLALIFVVGLFIFGAQLNLSAISANYYPVYMRSTGIGWAMGMGRFGSFVGPTIGGALIAYGFARGEMFLSAAIPALLAGLIVIVMSFNVPRMDEAEADGPASPRSS